MKILRIGQCGERGQANENFKGYYALYDDFLRDCGGACPRPDVQERSGSRRYSEVHDGASPKQRKALSLNSKRTDLFGAEGAKAGVSGSNIFVIVGEDIFIVPVSEVSGKSKEYMMDVIAAAAGEQLGANAPDASDLARGITEEHVEATKEQVSEALASVDIDEAARAATETAWEGISTADLAQAVEYISRKMTDRNGCFWVAEESGVIVGSIMVGFYGHRGSINYLAIAQERQRSALDAELMRRAEAFLIGRGCPKVSFCVRKNNEAVLAFYGQLGNEIDDIHFLGKRLISDV
ncbi:MAG: GNAT family N-acetyltransferase [Pseudomonadota bacterium]|nr:GNAT family N-acetyltransferase [Pseudomonadota bacterium]